ncbi:MAG: uracil-DNA glycosylase [bacterium]
MNAHPRNELADIARRLRIAVEIQGILREERTRPAATALRRLRAEPAEVGAPRVRPAARVVESGRAAATVEGSSGPAVTPAAASAPAPAARVLAPWEGDPARADSLGGLHDLYAACERCALGKTRKNFVFGVGAADARVMFVGEAPGRDEDLQGEPFVGAAGQLLNKILAAIEFAREDVYIANILKCRPPGNRDPRPEEIASCEPILRRQIELIRPVVLCTLGAFAARTMLGVTSGISRLRGRVHDYRGIPLVATYHPAALLRNPAWKRPTWEDVQLLRREYDARVGGAGGSS